MVLVLILVFVKSKAFRLLAQSPPSSVSLLLTQQPQPVHSHR